jgi:hypothetical protein
MNLNRHNYEEFFLLYADNELSDLDRKDVEAFVLDHPDLKEELTLFCQLKINPDPKVVFDHKEGLLKHSNQSPARAKVWEERFLLYVDQELDEKNRRAVEEMAVQDPDGLGRELELLLETRLDRDEKIIFQNKELLYKKEPERKLRPLIWLRLAAAVMVLAMSGWFLLKQFRAPQQRETTRAVASTPKQTDPESVSNKNSVAVTSHSTPALHNPMANEINSNIKKLKVRSLTLDNGKQQSQAESSIGRQGSTEQTARTFKLPEVARVSPSEHPSLSTRLNQDIAFVSVPALERTSAKALATDTQMVASDFDTKAKFIDQASSNKEDGINFITFSARKNNMRGLIRKVSRVFDKTTNVDDDNKRGLLVGNFQIALK